MGARARARGHRRARRLRRRTRAAREARGLTARGALRLAGFTWTPLGRRRPAVDALDLAVDPGERVLLAGPSGSGKSTVLRALAGLLGDATPGEAAGLVERGGTAGLLLQDPDDAQVAATVGRDVAFGPENAGLSRDRIWARVHEALELVRLGLPDDHPARATSGGQRQRLALAGVLALRPDVLLLDEPTSMLDPENAAAVRASVVEVADRTGATVVLVEHRLGPWLDHVDRVVVLDAGQVVADVAPDGVRGDSALTARGLWVPGVSAPTPVALPDGLVRPAESPPALRAEAVDVELVTRTLRGPLTRRALSGVDAALPSGRVTAWTGPSGAGKSTLAAVLGGLLPPTRGRVVGVDEPPHRWPSPTLARVVGWVPQQPEHGFLTRRVADEIALTAGRTARAVDVEAVAAALRLHHLLDADPFGLSGGEQRRLALAAALAHRPGVVLLDEPTVGQDRGTWAAVAGWLTSAAGAGAAVGVATHDPDLVALADDRVRLAGGRVAT